jgi:hypothetical protein
VVRAVLDEHTIAAELTHRALYAIDGKNETANLKRGCTWDAHAKVQPLPSSFVSFSFAHASNAFRLKLRQRLHLL